MAENNEALLRRRRLGERRMLRLNLLSAGYINERPMSRFTKRTCKTKRQDKRDDEVSTQKGSKRLIWWTRGSFVAFPLLGRQPFNRHPFSSTVFVIVKLTSFELWTSFEPLLHCRLRLLHSYDSLWNHDRLYPELWATLADVTTSFFRCCISPCTFGTRDF